MGFSAFTFLIGLFLSATISSCNKGNSVDGTKDSTIVAINMKNISYGPDTAQKLDIYLPADRDAATTKVILFIHGGSWIGGDKTEFNDAIAALRDKLADYAMFNMNYRLANGQNRFPSQIDDIQRAISFIESKSTEYKVDANKICLVGASAGGHLALLQAYKYNKDERIKAVVDLFGPADLTDLYNNHPIPQEARYVLTNLLGKTPATAASLYQQASPINFVNGKTVPTLIFHGSNDIVVPITQSNALKAKLLAHDVKVEMTSYALEGHGWYGKNLVDTYSKTVEFIKKNVR
jgi:acetyl esterase/lipase